MTVIVNDPDPGDVIVLDEQTSTQILSGTTGDDILVLTSDGAPGPAGPEGPPGREGDAAPAVVSGTYDWVGPMVMLVAAPRPMGPEGPIGLVYGDEIPAVGESSSLEIGQIDKYGLNCGYFEVNAGQHLLVQCLDEHGLHDLLITDRVPVSDWSVSIYYQVVSTDGTQVVGGTSEISLYAALPGEPVVGPIGPPGPQGVPGTPGAPGRDGAATEYYAEFQFITPLTTWVLEHNQHSYGLSVQTLDLNDNPFEGTVRYVSPDVIEVDWYYPMTGLARVFS
jgi:hypothetical protein